MLCFLHVGRKREKKKWSGAFFPGLDMPCWRFCVAFSLLLDAIKR
jgi:hypothetical protein